jgi:hypothetical protein
MAGVGYHIRMHSLAEAHESETNTRQSSSVCASAHPSESDGLQFARLGQILFHIWSNPLNLLRLDGALVNKYRCGRRFDFGCTVAGRRNLSEQFLKKRFDAHYLRSETDAPREETF